MGTLILAAAKSTTQGTSPLFFIVLIVLIGLFYVLMIRPQRNRQRRAMQMQQEVVPGQKIRTTAGLYGTVVSGDDRDVVVEIAPGVQVRMLRRAIMDVLPPDEDVTAGAAAGSAADGSGAPESQPVGEDREVKDRNG